MSLPENGMSAIARALQFSECRPEDKVDALSFVSHHLFFKTAQLRDLLNICPSAGQRTDFMVLLLFRLTDVWNMKILRTRLDGTQEWEELKYRLGRVALFPFIPSPPCLP